MKLLLEKPVQESFVRVSCARIGTIDMAGMNKGIVDDLLCHGRVYEVGGCVRDALLGDDIECKDRDYLVTGIPLADLVVILKKHGYVDQVGRSFGVLKFSPRAHDGGENITFDVALPRKEISTGSAHRDFDVDFDHSIPIEDDLLRRDFTINAMARDLQTGELIDPFDGQLDLKNHLLKMIKPRCFEEDPLRVLRGVQFASRFDLRIEDETFEAMKRYSDRITTVSPERISEELTKLLTRSKKPSTGFSIMRDIGMLKLVLPELEETIGVTQPGGYHAHNVFEHLLATVDAVKPTLRLRWAALLHDITKPLTKQESEDKATFYGHESSGARIASRILGRLRYSNEVIRDVKTLIERHMFVVPPTDKGLRRLIRKTGVNLIFDLLDLRRADVVGQGMGNTTEDIDEFEARIRAELDRKPPFSVNDLEIGGKEVMEVFGIPESPKVGDILTHLLELVLDYPEKNEKEILIEAVKDYLHSEETR